MEELSKYLSNYFFNSKLISLLIKFPSMFHKEEGSLVGFIGYVREDFRRRIMKYMNIIGLHHTRKYAMKNIINLYKYLFEVVAFCKNKRKNLLKDTNLIGREYLDYALKKNSGVILLSTNFGGYVWGLIELLNNGYTNLKIIKQENLVINSEIVSHLQKKGYDIEFLSSNVTEYQFLKQNGILCLFIDCFEENRSLIPIEFLGNSTYISDFPVSLSLLTGATILPMLVVHNNKTYEVIIEKPLDLTITQNKKQDIVNNLSELCKRVEVYIRRHPDQWYKWQHLDKVWENDQVNQSQKDKIKEEFKDNKKSVEEYIKFMKIACDIENQDILRPLDIGLMGIELTEKSENVLLRKQFKNGIEDFLSKSDNPK